MAGRMWRAGVCTTVAAMAFAISAPGWAQAATAEGGTTADVVLVHGIRGVVADVYLEAPSSSAPSSLSG